MSSRQYCVIRYGRWCFVALKQVHMKRYTSTHCLTFADKIVLLWTNVVDPVCKGRFRLGQLLLPRAGQDCEWVGHLPSTAHETSSCGLRQSYDGRCDSTEPAAQRRCAHTDTSPDEVLRRTSKWPGARSHAWRRSVSQSLFGLPQHSWFLPNTSSGFKI